MNTKMTATMHELDLHHLAQVAGGGEYNWKVWIAGPVYGLGYTLGYWMNS
ncbi:hypothetical protein [Neisseria canis]|uniref:Bacteriocin n=1 Tax=Neisseria canis TaxID=493 RepID=A0A448D8Y4_9NEIS|nr:hypothetical protein [Neisseria canis]VEF01862.1 Uncharacterised protein [Neisseria canis]